MNLLAKIQAALPLLLAAFACGALTNCETPALASPPIWMSGGFQQSLAERQRLAPLAEAGDSEAATLLGNHYAFIMLDNETSLYWYRKAAEHGGELEKENFKTYLEASQEAPE